MAFEIFAKLGLDQRGFAAGLTQARGKVAQFAAGVKGQIAMAFGATALTALAKRTIDYASVINDLSKKTGMGIETLQEFEYALKLSGGTIEDVTRATRALSKAREDHFAHPAGLHALGLHRGDGRGHAQAGPEFI